MATVQTDFYNQNPLKSVLDYQGQVDRNMLSQQAVQGNALVFQDRQRAINEQNQIRNVLASLGANATDEQRVGALRSTGTQTGYGMADALEKSLIERQKGQADVRSKDASTTKTNTETVVAIAEQFKKDLPMVQTPQAMAEWLQAQYSHPILGPEVAKRLGPLEQALSRIPQEPQTFMQVRDQAALGMDKFISEQTQRRWQDTQAATSLATNAATNARAAAEGAANRAARASEAAANRATTERGQDLTNERMREANAAKVVEKEKAAAEKKESAQTDAAAVIAILRSQYDVLDNNAAITSTDRGVVENVAASIGASPVGQVFGRAVGTESQSARNQIVMARPALVNAIIRATGMSAKSIDSNAELKQMLLTVTDPTLDIKANRAALDRLENSLASGKFKQSKSSDNNEQKPSGGLGKKPSVSNW